MTDGVSGVVGYVKSRLEQIDRRSLGDDAAGGLVLGVESVPDSLASGLLAGVNPVAGFYGYLFGMLGGAFFTGTSMMAIQGTSALSIIVAEENIGDADDPTKALVTLSVLTGVFMIAAGLLGLGKVFRLISRGVIAGFMSAIGLNIVLGQVSDFTGYDADGDNRLEKVFDTVTHLGEVSVPTITIGVMTLVLIALLSRTRLGSMGIVLGVVVGSMVAVLGGEWFGEVQLLTDNVQIPNRLPWLTLPSLGAIPTYFLTALSLAFVGLIQGAGLAATYTNPDGKPVPAAEDFYGQGMGNVASGLFQGVPVGGSISASALAVSGGGRTRATYLFAAGVMTIIILVLNGVIGYVAMPALAALLISVGISSMHLGELKRAIRAGRVEGAVVLLTFLLTVIIPIQFAVLIGAGASILFYVAKQSNELVVKQLIFDDSGVYEQEPPERLGANEVVVVQHYGGLFFGTARTFEKQLPVVDSATKHSVLIIRTRGVDEIGTTVAEMLRRVVDGLHDADSRLVIVTNNEQFRSALEAAQVLDRVGTDHICISEKYLFQATKKAYDDAKAWTKDPRKSVVGVTTRTWANPGAKNEEPDVTQT